MNRSRQVYKSTVIQPLEACLPTTMALPAYATVLIISTTISAVFACNGYQVTNLRVTPCDKETVLKFDNFNVKLTDDCKAVPSGCIKILKDVKGGEGTYEVTKAPMLKMGGKKSLCPLLESSKKSDGDVQLIFKLLNLEQKCPLKAKNMCPKGQIDITKYKDKLKLLEGDSIVKIKGKTTDGDEVCTETKLTISKAGGSAPSFMG